MGDEPPPRSELVKSMVFQGFKFAQCVLSPHLDIKKIVKLLLIKRFLCTPLF